MDANYIYNSFKNNFDNEILIGKLKELKNSVIMEAIKQGNFKNMTEVQIDFEKAVREGQLDNTTFEIIYCYIKFLSGGFLFHVSPHEDFEYVITARFFCTLTAEQTKEKVSAFKEILNIILPDIANTIDVGSEIDSPFTHTIRETPLRVNLLKRELTEEEKEMVTKMLIGELTSLSVGEKDSPLGKVYNYNYSAFGMPVFTTSSIDKEAYKQSMDKKSKDDILFLYKTADNIDVWVYKMFAAIFAAASN